MAGFYRAVIFFLTFPLIVNSLSQDIKFEQTTGYLKQYYTMSLQGRLGIYAVWD
jgi:hypothetical protein